MVTVLQRTRVSYVVTWLWKARRSVTVAGRISVLKVAVTRWWTIRTHLVWRRRVQENQRLFVGMDIGFSGFVAYDIYI
jgi:hypothetical protein